jgi:hypothetical protein
MSDQIRTEIPSSPMSSPRRRATLAAIGAVALATVQRSPEARAAKAGKKSQEGLQEAARALRGIRRIGLRHKSCLPIGAPSLLR